MIDVAAFIKSWPKPVECSQVDYGANKAEIDSISASHGYKFLGFRFDMAIFSSKNLDSTEQKVCSLGFNHKITLSSK